MHKGEHLLATAQAAKILRVDVRTVQRMVTDGRLTPKARVPGRTGALLFAEDDIRALAAAREPAA